MGGELVISNQYTALTIGAELGKVISANVGGGGFTRFDLERVKIPTGGGKTWLVPTLDGEENVKDITGIIVAWRDARVFWSKPAGEGGDRAPDCSSEDAEMGLGEPGGMCAKCPMAEFGTAKGGTAKGQACKLVRLLLVVRSGDRLPMLVSLPPTSLAPMRKYMLRLTNAGLPYFGVETRLSLEAVTNAGGNPYSRVIPTMTRQLDKEALANLAEYQKGIRQIFETVSVKDASDNA